MFCFRIRDEHDRRHAIAVIGRYDVPFSPLAHDDKLYYKVYNNDTLCEMYCQMNYHQEGKVCPVCAAEGESICGHLTFGRYIDG